MVPKIKAPYTATKTKITDPSIDSPVHKTIIDELITTDADGVIGNSEKDHYYDADYSSTEGPINIEFK